MNFFSIFFKRFNLLVIQKSKCAECMLRAATQNSSDLHCIRSCQTFHSVRCSFAPGVAKLRPAGCILLADQFRPAKYLAHFFKHHVADCGQQCNSIGCCLSHKSHCIRPSGGQAVANSAFGSKS